GAKFGGCSKGECGACSILLDGKVTNACSIFAVQAEGHSVQTIESIGEHPTQGWRRSEGLSVLQQAFVETGAVQCGYCTPAMVLATHELLQREIYPTEEQIRQVLSGILCRCTGYIKPVEAVLRAAAILRGEYVPPIEKPGLSTPVDLPLAHASPGENQQIIDDNFLVKSKVLPRVFTPPDTEKLTSVGKPEIKVDAVKLVQGKPAFTDDFEMRGMLIAKVLHSPVAHARIKNIDVSKAKSLPGVAAVLTYKDLPRVVYATAGQSDPMPGPLDTFSLDNKVRFVGDRVAFVAAETEEIANQALKLINVEYEELPFIIDPRSSMSDGAVKIHDEPEYVVHDLSDPNKNVAAAIRIDIGDLDNGFSEADQIIEAEYKVPKVHQAHIEPHVSISYWDENDRLVIRTSTQVPFHVRRILAPVLGLPMKRIRVIKPRIGGGFGSKQEVLIEDVVAHLTIATKRPVRYEYTREEEFIAARSRHPMIIKLKTGVKNDGTITANEMYALSDTGAYGCHALTVTGNTGHKAMALYTGDGKYRKAPNIRFYADIVYTNTPPSGAYRGYGAPQGFWAVERHMETIAAKLGMDPIQFRLKNCLRAGEIHPFSIAWSEGREPKPEYIQTIGIEQCVHQGKSAIGWDQKYGKQEWRDSTDKPYLKRGIGMALMMHGTAIAYLDMGGASIKMNEDGSFNLLVGATDLGTGSDTVLTQMAAEVLGVPVDDFIVYSSDTDFTPFDKGAYASSTTYISGAATTHAAAKVAERIRVRAAMILNDRTDGAPVKPDEIILKDRRAHASDGRAVTYSEIGHHSLHHKDQEQIMAVASYVSPVSPPPFAAQFAEIVMDIETGQVKVEKLVMAVDAGRIVNPVTASGQIEGGMTQALGYAVCEEMTYDDKGAPVERDLVDYHIFRADEMPELETIFVETFESSHPFGVKAVAEIPLDGVAPAVANAIYNASGAMLYENPATPDRVWKALQKQKIN
ncbi:MAG: molybdopterin-dependent oxidoreductase, partial [Anaerolineae bacterium]|nr:molybdopterin-dependent oxidoreductase [Anaerolineae bacterium]